MLKIRFCRHNAGARSVCRQLVQEFPQLDIKHKDCLKQCKVCRSIPFVMVGKHRISAESGELLMSELRRTIADLID
jgi:uncharacterized protein YuzB (UPF0349 family)